jgi:opacity protein-like surface antigen
MKTMLVPVLVFTISSAALADNSIKPSSRTDKWEFGILLNHVDSWDLTGRNGSTIDVDSDTGLGFNMGYNFNEHFNLSLDISFNSQSYDAVAIPVDDVSGIAGEPVNIHHNLDNDAFNFSFTYNITARTLTPFISGELGWTYLDSNISNSEVETVCWWDPWWGYICTPYVSTYSTTPFSYGIGAGLRWDVTHTMAIKASIDQRWLNVDGVNDNAELLTGKIGLSWMMY